VFGVSGLGCYPHEVFLRVFILFWCFLSLSASALSAQQWGPWQAVGPFEHLLGHINLDEGHEPERQLSEMKPGRPGPKLERVFRGKGNMQTRWHEVAGGSTAFDVGQISFDGCLAPVPDVSNWADYSAAYLYRKAELGSARDVRVHMGSDDAMKVWLNGAFIFERTGGRGVDLYDEALVLPMREGVNHLFIKVVNGEGGWGFRMGPWRKLNQLGINQAIDRGVDHFLQSQQIDGTWGHYGHLEPGPTAFTLYTLLKCGVRMSHPVVQRARAYILARKNSATYALATKVLALAEMNDEGDVDLIEDLLEEMWDRENRDVNEIYRYSVDAYHAEVMEGDLSNALFAGLAMRAGNQVGVSIPSKRWTELARGALACLEASDGLPRTGAQAAPRGFKYRVSWSPTSSMTVAGVSLLAIADELAGKKIVSKLRGPVKMGVRHGLAWLDDHFAWSTNAGHPDGSHNFFSIYGIERVGGLLGRPVVANRDWYFEGSEYLLARQSGGGTWSESSGHVETELALLFLKRATARASGKNRDQGQSSWSTADDPAASVALRGIGDTPATFWVESFHEDLLPELEWEGQGGKGPHVSRVDFFARRDIPGGEVLHIARGTADPGEPVRGERFAIRHRFPANGVWLIHARVMCIKEPMSSGVLGEEFELLSGEMEVLVKDVVTEEQLAYAEQTKNNLLRGAQVHASASSQNGVDDASRAVDGHHSTRWHCATNDNTPHLKLSLGRPIRGRKIMFSHAWPRPKYVDSPRPFRGQLIINGRDTIPWEMDPDPMTKTLIDLGKSHRIRSLELRITDTLNAKLGNGAFGFSEVEVYR
jgi:hypothetical protein